MSIVLGVEFMVAVTAPFYCQLCCSFSSSISEAQAHLLSVGHNEKYKVCCSFCVNCSADYQNVVLSPSSLFLTRSTTHTEREMHQNTALLCVLVMAIGYMIFVI